MTSNPSNYHREYSPYGSYSLFQFEGSDVISVLKNSVEYNFVFFKCLFVAKILYQVFSTIQWSTGCLKKVSINTFILTNHKSSD